MHIGKGYDSSATRWGKGGGHPLPQGRAGQHPVCKRRWMQAVSYSIVWWIQAAQASYSGEAQHQEESEVCHHEHPYPRAAEII